jgi:hypothetical protein
VVALLEQEAAELVDLDRQIAHQAPGDCALQVALGMTLVLRFAEGKAAAARAYFIDMLGVPEARALRERIERAFEAHILLELTPAFASGELLSLDPRSTVRAFMGSAKETAVAWLEGSVLDLDQAIRESVRFTLMGLGVDPARARALAEEAATTPLIDRIRAPKTGGSGAPARPRLGSDGGRGPRARRGAP